MGCSTEVPRSSKPERTPPPPHVHDHTSNPLCPTGRARDSLLAELEALAAAARWLGMSGAGGAWAAAAAAALRRAAALPLTAALLARSQLGAAVAPLQQARPGDAGWPTGSVPWPRLLAAAACALTRCCQQSA